MADFETLPRFSDFIIELMSPANQPESAGVVMGEQQQMRVERLSVDLPFELDLNTNGAKPALHASPPMQYTETTIMPVFHRIRVTIECDPTDEKEVPRHGR